ncbi:MAG: hypothetical protein AAF827_16085 [Cyanobacteria bacterium P01_D01_bin.6]
MIVSNSVRNGSVKLTLESCHDGQSDDEAAAHPLMGSDRSGGGNSLPP